MSKLLVGNQKMNMTSSDVNEFLRAVMGKLNENVILCPSSIYIPYYINKGFKVGLQNVFYEPKGSYTGEVSPLQAKSLGLDYVIIGHSERRTTLREKESDIQKKVNMALRYDMSVILCIGETLEERSLNKTDFVLRKQIYSALVGSINIKKLYIAYEPLWAIGSGKVASVEEIERISLFIKDTVKKYKDDAVKVLYGGSVDSNSIASIIGINSIDGVLVGKASCNAEEVLKMKEVVENQ